MLQVLILVLLEDGLGEFAFLTGGRKLQKVLILVLLEDGLGD